MDTPTTPVTLAELARATDDLPLTPHEGTLTSAPAPLTPSAEDVETLTAQYRKAVNGLYGAYVFGQMLAQVKARLEQFTGSLTRETARELTQTGANGGTLAAPGWNAGTGLKAWLAPTGEPRHRGGGGAGVGDGQGPKRRRGEQHDCGQSAADASAGLPREGEPVLTGRGAPAGREQRGEIHVAAAYPAVDNGEVERLRNGVYEYLGLQMKEGDANLLGIRRRKLVKHWMDNLQELLGTMLSLAQAHASDRLLAEVLGRSADAPGLRRDVSGGFRLRLEINPENLFARNVIEKTQALGQILGTMDRQRAGGHHTADPARHARALPRYL